jgi:hypothetical protein
MNFPLQLTHVRILNDVFGWKPPNCPPDFCDVFDRLVFFNLTELIKTFQAILKKLYSPCESHILNFAVCQKIECSRILAGESQIARNDCASSVGKLKVFRSSAVNRL